MPPPANLPAAAASAAPPRPRLRLLPRWLRRLPLPLLLLHSRLLDGLDVGPPAPPARSTCSSRTTSLHRGQAAQVDLLESPAKRSGVKQRCQ